MNMNRCGQVYTCLVFKVSVGSISYAKAISPSYWTAESYHFFHLLHVVIVVVSIIVVVVSIIVETVIVMVVIFE